MPSRSATEEDVAKLPPLILGGPHWPAAEAAGLISVGGMWMRPENAERFIEALRRKREHVDADRPA